VRYDFAKGFVFVEGQQVDDELRLPGSLTDAEVLIDRRATNTPNDYSNQTTDIARGGFGVALGSAWSLLAEYSDRNEESEYENWGLTAASMRVKSLTPRLIGEFATEHGQSIVTIGYDDVDSFYESNNAYSPHDSQQQQQSYYAQAVYPVIANLTLTAGARFAQVEDKNYLQSLSQDDELQATELGLSYDAGNNWRVFGRYAESFRFANPDENNLVADGVVFLDPQTGESFELGTQWQSPIGSVTYSIYSMTLNDEIVYDGSVPNNQFYNGANINLPDSERQGFMLNTNTVLSKELSLRFNYTYTDAEVVDGMYDGKVVPFVAENSAAANIIFTPLDALNIFLEGIYTGTRYKSNDDANVGPKLPELVVFNLGTIYTYKQLEFSGRINNLTNELYAGLHATWGQYPQPERNYEASVTYRF
jgi:iron complex outermembrane receptor protein